MRSGNLEVGRALLYAAVPPNVFVFIPIKNQMKSSKKTGKDLDNAHEIPEKIKSLSDFCDARDLIWIQEFTMKGFLIDFERLLGTPNSRLPPYLRI